MAIDLSALYARASSLADHPLRAAALDRLKQLGWPHSRSEAWTYFPLSLFAKLDLPALEGITAPAQSENPEEFGLENEKDLAALLPLLLGDGPRTYQIVDGGIPDTDLALATHAPFSHAILRMGKGSKARLLLPRAQDSHAFISQRLDIFCEEGSELEIITPGEGSGSRQLGLRHLRVTQEASSRLRVLAMHAGSDAFRASLDINLAGAGASFEYRALSLLHGQGQSHRQVRISHQAPQCESRQSIRQLVTGEAHASYAGGVDVGINCPGTVSGQLINSLLLSPKAKASCKPVLRIFHDDVECTHGSTCSDLDAESLFYLGSRGVPPQEARRLLIAAFATEIALAHPESSARTSFLGRLHHELEPLTR